MTDPTKEPRKRRRSDPQPPRGPGQPRDVISREREHIDEALDEALDESFPASDPVSIVTDDNRGTDRNRR